MGWFGLFDKKEMPPWWQAYEKASRPTESRRTPIRELSFVVFDTETSGLNPREARLLSIGAVRVHQQEIDLNDHLDLLVQSQPSPSDSVPIHGILPQENRDRGLPPEEVLKTFLEYAGGDILVGHHVGFDMAMVNRLTQAIVGKSLRNRQLDTGQLAVRAELGRNPTTYPRGQYALDALCERYNLPDHDRHTAAGDALITAILLLKLLARLEKKGVKTLGDLFR